MKVAALDEGAEDYVTKPFSMQELLARVRAQLRKSARQPQEATHICVGDFEIDTEQHSVHVRQQEVHLTPKEFALLLVFARHPSQVLTHRTLLKAVWAQPVRTNRSIFAC
jgi:two-component system, OmpR family, KDP operon response regulator KdpE